MVKVLHENKDRTEPERVQPVPVVTFDKSQAHSIKEELGEYLGKTLNRADFEPWKEHGKYEINVAFAYFTEEMTNKIIRLILENGLLCSNWHISPGLFGDQVIATFNLKES